MVHGILIPVSDSEDLEARTFNTPEDYQSAVGGVIDAVDVFDLGAMMYVNEEGLLFGLPFNRRATFLWWYYVPAVRNRALLLGDAVLVGWPDRDGDATDIPVEVQTRLLSDTRHRVQVRRLGTQDWRDDLAPGQPFLEALIWASLICEVAQELEIRVIPEG